MIDMARYDKVSSLFYHFYDLFKQKQLPKDLTYFITIKCFKAATELIGPIFGIRASYLKWIIRVVTYPSNFIVNSCLLLILRCL